MSRTSLLARTMQTRYGSMRRGRGGALAGSAVDTPKLRWIPRLLGAVAASAWLLVAQAALAQEPLELDLGSGVSLSLVRVPANTFSMGSRPDEPGRKDDEVAHEVILPQDFYIGVTPVTRGQFTRFVTETGYRTEAEKGTSGGHGWNGTELVQDPRYTWKDPGFPQTDDHPVVLVTYDDALAFTRWLSRKTGRNVTLPTEAQWEYAARGNASTPWFAAQTSDEALALGWFRENAGGGTHPVKQRPPNGFGLHDVAGSVWEWCLDWYGPYPTHSEINPMVASPPAGETPRRVLRGGSWLTSVDKSRAAARYRNTPGSRNADNGFRVVVDGAAAAIVASETDAGDSGGAGLGWLALVGGLGVTGTAFAVRNWRRRQQSPGRSLLSVRTVPDGFWIDRPLRAGTRVRWSARLGGMVHTGQSEATGGPLFVYTGRLPENVKASVVMPRRRPSGGGMPGGARRHGMSTGSEPDAWSQQFEDARDMVAYHAVTDASQHHDSGSSSGSTSEPFSGWPSAY